MSTTQELIDYYAKLLVLQYVGKPKAFATIQATAKMFIMDQLPTAVENAFNVQTAVGVQLDVLGKYAGVTRTGVGFSGNITLDDSDFQVLIQLATIKNSAGSSLYDIQNLLNTFFPGEILVFDYANMRLSYLVSSAVGSQDLVQLFVTEGLLPKPMGVQLSVTIYAPDIKIFFGCCDYLVNVVNNSPLNTYEDYQTNRPFLRYENGVFA